MGWNGTALSNAAGLAGALKGVRSRQGRAILVANEALRGEAFGAGSSGSPRCYGAEMVQASLMAAGWQVHPYTLPRAMAVGAEPRIEAARKCAEHARRTGANLVVAVGDFAAMNVAKAVARFALVDCDIGDAMDVAEEDKFKSRKEKRENLDSGKDMRLAFAAVPTVPAAGCEISGSIRLMDWEKERRYFVSNDELAMPDILCLDKQLMAKSSPKRGVHRYDAQFVVAQALGQLLDGKPDVNALRKALVHVGNAEQLRTEKRFGDAFVELANASKIVGEQEMSFDSGRPKAAVHFGLAHGLCDLLPLSFPRTVASLLEEASKLWTLQEQTRVGDLLASAQLEENILQRTEGLLDQGIHIDEKEHLTFASQNAASWLEKDEEVLLTALTDSLQPVAGA